MSIHGNIHVANIVLTVAQTTAEDLNNDFGG